MTDNIIQFIRKKDNILSEESEERLQKAISARDDYINSLEGKRLENAIDLQIKIDKALSKAGNQNNRLSTIGGMMMESFFNLNEKLQKLKDDIIQK